MLFSKYLTPLRTKDVWNWILTSKHQIRLWKDCSLPWKCIADLFMTKGSKVLNVFVFVILIQRGFLLHCKRKYRISANSFRGDYSFLKVENVEIFIYRISTKSFLPWIVSAPVCTVTKVYYSLKYGILNIIWTSWFSQLLQFLSLILCGYDLGVEAGSR